MWCGLVTLGSFSSFLFYYTHVFSYGVRLRGLSEECIDNKEGERERKILWQ